MDGDRKYRQPGYQGSGRDSNNHHPNGTQERGVPPRHPMDLTAPRTPRLVQAVTATRCYSCSTVLPAGTDFVQPCGKCKADLHCCKQCTHFEPSTRFQCQKPISERIPYKDRMNECAHFAARVTVARDTASPAPAVRPLAQISQEPAAPKSVIKARAAFENLFKK